MLRDGHIHTPYCPHGSQDHFQQYIERAISLGYKEITFTEHAPLPSNFKDPAPAEDSGMNHAGLEQYIQDIEKLKNQYSSDLKINTGLEVDYIEGYENQTIDFLNQYGPHLEDSILSVHFLKKNDEWFCLDYSPEVFEEMIGNYGGLPALYDHYFQTVLKSIVADLGPFKPKRIGHITLVKKFQKKFPLEDYDYRIIQKILHEMKAGGYEMDYNGAGLFKPFCKESYPPRWIAEEADSMGIPLVYGSDAHQASDLDQGRKDLF
ncbi:histidinol-phosphatase HisJ [Falsibacillus pallidus]|uniref:Histidinol-phosphatase n=1 Tax=Falsibacillus pallidus TaxID=493781 RepID=A0A370GLR2_9BACI|nr:histidinol-phosphatase HisJ [Falsibacillus pallidus]RDI44290.1 histidinol-phosphate phosphatase [Falsibacillus pallidus]